MPASSALLEFYSGCPLCGSADEQNLGEFACDWHALWHDGLPRTLTWLRCRACTHVHTEGFWTSAGLEAVFRKAHPDQVAGGDADQKRYIWSPVVQSLVTVLGGYERISAAPTRPAWLDAGCGDGGLIMTAQEFGFDATGLDARAVTVDALTALGFKALKGDLSNLQERERYDVISLCDVLEHVPYPGRTLERVLAALKPGGLCFVSCPNSECGSWKLLDNKGANPYWGEIEHHHNFSATRLKALLTLLGLTVVHYDVSIRYRSCMEMIARKNPRA